MLNDLDPKTRKRIYQIFALVSLAIGAVAVAYSSIPGVDLPAWQIAAANVWAFIGTGIGYVAQSNTAPLTTGEPAPEIAPEDTEAFAEANPEFELETEDGV